MPSSSEKGGRRSFLRGLPAAAGLTAAAPLAAQAQTPGPRGSSLLPAYARAQDYRSSKQSSYDVTGGNADRWPIAPGATHEVFNQKGPGIISHIWCTIAAQSQTHLKDLVMRIYWDGNTKPSVECPIGDFFGLNLGQYVIYQSAYLACSPGRSLNCYFAMPYRKSARITVTNEGTMPVGAFYSNIDFMTVPALPPDALYFHAQYRQATPCIPVKGPDAPVVDDFLAATGISRGTFYNHFGSVPELLEATSVWTTDTTVASIDAALGGIEDPAVRFGTGLRLFLAKARSDPVWSLFIARVWKLGPLRPARRDLRAGVRTGAFRVGDVQVALGIVLGGMRAALLEIGAGRRSMAYVDQVVELCLRALGVEASRIAEVLGRELPTPSPDSGTNAARHGRKP